MRLFAAISLVLCAALILLIWWAILDPSFNLVPMNRFVFSIIAALVAMVLALANLWPILKKK